MAAITELRKAKESFSEKKHSLSKNYIFKTKMSIDKNVFISSRSLKF